MNTNITMTASAVFLGLLGVAAQFLPAEILLSLDVTVNLINKSAIQLIGALWLGFAMLNWMAKDNLMGGVYSRPVAIGNFTHFLIGAITFLKIVFNVSNTIVIILTIVYSIFALIFAKIVFTHPLQKKDS